MRRSGLEKGATFRLSGRPSSRWIPTRSLSHFVPPHLAYSSAHRCDDAPQGRRRPSNRRASASTTVATIPPSCARRDIRWKCCITGASGRSARPAELPWSASARRPRTGSGVRFRPCSRAGRSRLHCCLWPRQGHRCSRASGRLSGAADGQSQSSGTPLGTCYPKENSELQEQNAEMPPADFSSLVPAPWVGPPPQNRLFFPERNVRSVS